MTALGSRGAVRTTSATVTGENDSILEIITSKCALAATCVHVLIRLYAEGIKGYCATKQTAPRQYPGIRQWYLNERKTDAEWYQSRQEPGAKHGRAR